MKKTIKTGTQSESPDPYGSERLISFDAVVLMAEHELLGDNTDEQVEHSCWADSDSVSRKSVSYDKTGLYWKLQHDPECKRWAKAPRDKRETEVLRQKEIYLSETSTPAEKERAVYTIYTVLFSFVHSLMFRFCGGYMNRGAVDAEDYIQVSLAEITKRLPGYTEGNVMSSYFYTYIKHVLVKTVAVAQDLSRFYNEHLTLVTRAIEKLSSNGKVYIDVADVSPLLPKVSPVTIKVCLDFLNCTYCDIEAFGESLPSHDSTPDEVFEKKESLVEVHKALDDLLPEQAKVIKAYYGIPSGPRHSIREIAEIIGTSPYTAKKLLDLGKDELAKSLSVKGFGVRPE